MELSIDTSTRYASVALSVQGEIIVEMNWWSKQNHSMELVPAILELMRSHRVDMSRLEALFVAGGPGGFSALRVGMSTSKGLAVALDIPLVSVGTLDIEARPYLGLLEIPVHAVIRAGRDKLYVGRYPRGIREVGPDCEVMTHDEVVSQIETTTLFCGEGLRDISPMLRELPDDMVKLADSPSPTRRPSVLADIGYRRLRAGITDDPSMLQPLYLRNSQMDVARRKLANN